VGEQLIAEVENALKLSELMGGHYKLEVIRGYPCTYNDPQVNQWMKQVTSNLLGDNAIVESPMGMGAEDFSYMTELAKGAMFMLGAALDGPPRHHHTEIFDIDERVLPMGTAVLAETARRYVTGQLA
jgi:amidohydrolase